MKCLKLPLLLSLFGVVLSCGAADSFSEAGQSQFEDQTLGAYTDGPYFDQGGQEAACCFSDPCMNNCCSIDSWFMRISGGYTFGRFAGFKDNYGELGLFVAPPTHGKWLPFVDLQGYLIEGNKWGATIGAGARFLDSCCERAYGGNIYYDFREASYHPFQRLGLGLESLGPCWDVRANGYLLINGTVKQRSLKTYTFPGGYVETCREKEFAFSGLDAEFGMPLYTLCDFTIYNALGPYYYQNSYEKFGGGYYRLQLNWKDYVRVEGRVSYDNKYQAQFQGMVLVSLPLYELCGTSCNTGDSCTRLLTRPVWRNPMITTTKCSDYRWNW